VDDRDGLPVDDRDGLPVDDRDGCRWMTATAADG